jgi:hypothetical protein
MDNTQWRPSGEVPDKTKRALSHAIRGRLPSIKNVAKPDWESGRLAEHELSADEPGAVHLKALSWRMLDQMDWQGRASARGVFSGQAWVNASLVDFTGDSVRDLATGAFFEFKLITIGL